MSLNFLPQFKPLFDNHRYKVLLSGRCSGKSVAIAIYLIWIASRVKVKVLCLREFMSSISESSMAQLLEVIEKSGTRSHWDVTKTEIVHIKTGSRFIFKGIRANVESIKSIPDVDLCWCEEASTLSQESLNILIPTIRKKNSQIIFSGNPKSRIEPLAQMFVENEPPPSTIIIANDYRDNPYVSNTLLVEAEHMKETNPEMYSHIYLGEYLDAANLIIIKNVVKGTLPVVISDKVIIGVDIARDGDRTVICARKGKGIAELKSYPSMDLTNLVHELTGFINRHKPEQINVDSTGHGAWVPDALKAFNIYVKPINFAESSRYDTKYANMRTEIYGLASDFFDNGGKLRPNDIELERELEASYYTLDNHNRIKLIPKDEIKKRIGKSPDLADAFCLSLITSGDMFKSTKKLEEIQQQNLGSSLVTAGSW